MRQFNARMRELQLPSFLESRYDCRLIAELGDFVFMLYVSVHRYKRDFQKKKKNSLYFLLLMTKY